MNPPNSYYPGNLIRLQDTITVASTDTDPSTISLVVISPAGVSTSYVPTHDGTGLYHYNWDSTGAAQGIWYYVYSSTGAAQGAAPQAFYIQAPVP